jgi:hypothetical protein
MGALVKSSAIVAPEEIRRFIEDPPVVGNETVQDYYAFFAAIAASVKPVDPIDWLFTKDVVDLSWHIRRERKIIIAYSTPRKMPVDGPMIQEGVRKLKHGWQKRAIHPPPHSLKLT